MEEPNAGVALVAWPNTAAAVGLAPNAGGWDPAENDGVAEPKAGAAGCAVP